MSRSSAAHGGRNRGSETTGRGHAVKSWKSSSCEGGVGRRFDEDEGRDVASLGEKEEGSVGVVVGEGAPDGIEDEVEPAAGRVTGYAHSVLRSRQDRQAGLASSHLTLRALQFLQPALDFLWGRLAWYGF